VKLRYLILLVLLAAGCQRKAIEVRHQPELNVPDQWSADDASSGGVLAEWWGSFEDPTLVRILEQGLEKNFNLQAAAARVEAASAQARIAGADRYPSISAGWSGSGQRQNFIGLPIPGSEGKVLSRTFASSGVSLDVSWEPDLWGRIAAGRLAALADVAAAQEDLRGARLSLTAQISKAWFGAIEGLQQVKLAESTVASYRDTSERVRSRYTRGLQSSLDLRLALSSISAAEALVEQRKQQLDLGIRQLEILLGDYPGARLDVIQELPGIPPPPPTGVPSELVSRRPDLIAAERRMWASGARWTQARRALYPSISLTGRIGTSTSDWLQVVNGDFFIWNLVGNVLQPVFQGGRLRAQVTLEDARSKEAAAQWATSVLQAFSEVEAALAAERFLAQQEADLTDAVEQATASQQLAEDRYQSGLEGFVTVLEAQRRSLDARSQLLNVRRQRLDTRVDLHLALGGGFEDEDPDPAAPDQKEGDS
jgi:NodT family efflux transporter outer membrane factor (OMF) lipoprotein